MTVRTISPIELDELVKGGQAVELIDVGAPAEFCEMNADSARNVPLESLDPQAVIRSRNGSAEEPLYVMCRTGNRGRHVAERFQRAGLENVFNVEGGAQSWEDAGLCVIRGKKTISLERQVRIAAGLLVVLGVIFGTLSHPYFLGLSAFVGAGLFHAGVTDTCAMAMALARIPWNQVKGAAECCMP
jgi:rhodanese-related sulfurtransferase